MMALQSLHNNLLKSHRVQLRALSNNKTVIYIHLHTYSYLHLIVIYRLTLLFHIT